MFKRRNTFIFVAMVCITTILCFRGSVYAAEAEIETESIEVSTEETNETVDENISFEINDIMLKDYFYRSVFIGDSVMKGFSNYCYSNQESNLYHSRFLAAVSYSTIHALKENDNFHPTYKGKKQPVWRSISEMEDISRAFILFGTNDLTCANVDKVTEYYEQLINKIIEANPDIEINIMSMTLVAKGVQKGCLSNTNIRMLNTKLQELAINNGWNYIDIATKLGDSNGDLLAAYCSDNYVHETRKAYVDVWEATLNQYAKDELLIELTK